MDVWLYINGIRHQPGRLDSWPDQFTHLTHFTTHARAYPAEHHFFVIRNYARLRTISDQIAVLILEYCQRGYRVHLCTHSNGAVVACRALRVMDTRASVETFHAIAPAAWADCGRNGLNQALVDRRLAHFFFYGSTHDTVVQYGRYTGWLLRPIGAGYGGMAFVGPREVDPQVAKQVYPFWASKPNPEWLKQWPRTWESRIYNYGHSDWFKESNYRQTFARIQRNTEQVCSGYAEQLQQHGRISAALIENGVQPISP